MGRGIPQINDNKISRPFTIISPQHAMKIALIEAVTLGCSVKIYFQKFRKSCKKTPAAESFFIK